MAPRRILVVDADAENVEILTAYLQWHGFNVSGAADPNRATRLAINETWDLLIIEVGALKVLRGSHASVPAKVIALNSGLVDSPKEDSDVYVSKPVDLAALLTEVRRLLA